MGRTIKRVDMFKDIVNMIKRKNSEKKANQEAFQREVEQTFPTLAHANADENMYGVLDPSQGHGMNNAQWRWMQNQNVTHPWQLQPNAFHDMMYSAEGMPQDTQNAMWRDYYKMNNLPDIMNTQKNIDILIKAADLDMSQY